MAVTRLRSEDVYVEAGDDVTLRLYLGDPDEHDPDTYYELDWDAGHRLLAQTREAVKAVMARGG